eukprot:1147154-Pelagomonas_calceolata.AAC.1
MVAQANTVQNSTSWIRVESEHEHKSLQALGGAFRQIPAYTVPNVPQPSFLSSSRSLEKSIKETGLDFGCPLHRLRSSVHVKFEQEHMQVRHRPSELQMLIHLLGKGIRPDLKICMAATEKHI